MASDKLERAAEVAAGGSLAYVGAAAGGPTAAALTQAAVPIASLAIAKAVEAVHDRRVQRAQDVLVIAAKETDSEIDDLVERLLADPKRISLLANAVDGASHAIAEEKINLFAKALANGSLMGDDAVLDKEIYIIEIFRQLEMPHIRVLRYLGEAYSPDILRPASVRTMMRSRSEIQRQIPQISTLVPLILNDLQRAHLIDVYPDSPISSLASLRHWIAVNAGRDVMNPLIGDDDKWLITGFGKECLTRLEPSVDS
jgi:hypothetical protein